jgi:uncharacterized protein YdcH (DUF465 family)
MNTTEKLDKLSSLEMAIETNREYFGNLKVSWMEQIPLKIKDELDKIDTEFNERQEEIDKQISELTEEIKQDVLNIGETVKGTYKMAVWNKARETVDMKQLKGYAVAHPEVNSMIKVGEPTVTLRKIGKGE